MSQDDTSLVFPEPLIHVTSWPDPVLDQLGHDPRSTYVERFWLPVLGPSCILLVRRLAADIELQPDGFSFESAQLAVELGLGIKGGRHGPFWRSLDRACRFGMAHRNNASMMVRRRLPPLSARQVNRLPARLRKAHEEWASDRLQRSRGVTVTRWVPHGPIDSHDTPCSYDDAA